MGTDPLGRTLELEAAAQVPEWQDYQLPDERLELLLLCAHPALNEKVRVPLMLNSVLGLSAQRIAAGFAVAPATMSARLLRAKGENPRNRPQVRNRVWPIQRTDPLALPKSLPCVLSRSRQIGWRDPKQQPESGSVAFESQDTSLWNRQLIEQAERTLSDAHRLGLLGLGGE